MPDTVITTADTGLGTTYERWALSRFLETLPPLAEVLEGPDDGMTGICGLNSLPLGRGGGDVTLWLPERPAEAAFARSVWKRYAPQDALRVDTAPLEFPFPYPDSAFDLVWNFNVMPRLPDPEVALREMARCSRRFVLVFVPNRRNYGFPLHRLHHRVAGEPWEHGDVAWMHPAPWKRLFEQIGLRKVRAFHVDCPWWPDIVNPAELLADFLPPLRHRLRAAEPEQRARWEADSLPYYDPQAYPEIHRRMERLAFFERLPFILQIPFAHHIGILGEKRL